MTTTRKTAEDKIRVLLVDAQAIYRQGVRSILANEPDIELVGETADGVEAHDLVEKLEPDIVITDSRLPGLDGLELTKKVRLASRATSFVVLSGSSDSEDEELLLEAIRAGAAAFFSKDSVAANDLLQAIRRAAKGEYVINDTVLTRPKVAQRVLQEFRELNLMEKEIEPLFAPLSNREIEILDYIARGNSNKEIARALKISDQTVKNHITSILRKLAVNDRTAAVVFALRRGWIKMD
ncbi:MAG: response regulator transcription factor [Dehalococcoidia bacterium]|nr:response regulator transcription factor [Dehalococcoidia bacterium]